MKKLAISVAALVLLSSVSLSGVQATPMFSPVDAQVAPSYTQVDCMERDGGPTGFCDYGPDMGSFAQDQSRQHTMADQHNGYRAYFNNSSNAKANSNANANAQFFGTGH